ncbi:peroxiredoxin family protein [Paenalcaligenes hominis]|uniref:Peroxiredoxin n=1 Tax=Paenalcaligenes hominis TaxID=643674 RepID=A0ABX0WQG3_9BURK|nr:TlpA disulfide reductase family protein [Paenalcaligenes hominis]NJB65013.1 peroxiredoxin [Paenalcaligenes hominis]GGE57374.1 thioredoxin [Paenalcaligenes hominis]
MIFRFLFISLLGVSLAACSDALSSAQAPEFSGQSLNGDIVNSDALQGKVTLVKFWATDCTTCVAQMPDNIEYYNQYHDKGFDIIAVAMKHDPIEYVRNFTEARQLPFTVVSDKDGAISQAFGDIRMTPTAFLIDKKGRVVKRYLGNYDKTAFIQTLEKALAG